ncbi:hypothetical protein J8J14_07650 [Roseomonas sp. SSH11]|uniref:Lipoprotein n=1 Tax=Pararoseomonas baculiformis TaxID=2820812 RepID=A0ABS4AEI5_9PROT|nr:hypothetical protein [Pararoseomonas baculiformis]MBP0444654.1 hypothetical protein [Pararoseomonas baculiformis]
MRSIRVLPAIAIAGSLLAGCAPELQGEYYAGSYYQQPTYGQPVAPYTTYVVPPASGAYVVPPGRPDGGSLSWREPDPRYRSYGSPYDRFGERRFEDRRPDDRRYDDRRLYGSPYPPQAIQPGERSYGWDFRDRRQDSAEYRPDGGRYDGNRHDGWRDQGQADDRRDDSSFGYRGDAAQAPGDGRSGSDSLGLGPRRWR